MMQKEVDANARLIAAAPDMRDVLERLIRAAHIYSDLEVSGAGGDVMREARALLTRIDSGGDQ